MEPGIDEALRAAGEWLALRRPPTHQIARALLVPLGQALLEGRDAEARPALERVRAWIEAAPERWAEAVASEISLAVTEHVRSVDPRFLEHPQYDLVYVVDARHRLEARLRAAEALGLPAADALLEAVERADARLEPRLRRAEETGRGNGKA